jgi:hypothetical protein
MRTFKKGARVNVPVGMESRCDGTVVSGPHKATPEMDAEHMKAWGHKFGTYYKVRVSGVGVLSTILRYIKPPKVSPKRVKKKSKRGQ